jgi:hypothetical protein
MSILPKNFCNMHIARRNMHIAIESILPLTHVRVSLIFAIIVSFMLFTTTVSSSCYYESGHN